LALFQIKSFPLGTAFYDNVGTRRSHHSALAAGT
jgi:hypothetical protein